MRTLVFRLLPLALSMVGVVVVSVAWFSGWALAPALLTGLLLLAAAQLLFFTGALMAAPGASGGRADMMRMMGRLRNEMASLGRRVKRLEDGAVAMPAEGANAAGAAATRTAAEGATAEVATAAKGNGRKSGERTPAPTPAAARTREAALSGFRLYMEPVADMVAGHTAVYRATPALAATGERLFLGAQAGLRASRLGVATDFDMRLLRETAGFLRRLADKGRKTSVICPLTPASLASGAFRGKLEEFLEANKDVTGLLVLDISQQSLSMLGEDGMLGLAWLAQHEVPLALSGARPEGVEPQALKKLGFSFIDMDARVISASLAHDSGAALGRVAKAGMELIASHVDDERMAARLKPFLRLARGRAFSPPRRVRLTPARGGRQSAGRPEAAPKAGKRSAA